VALTQAQIRQARNELVEDLFRTATCPFTKADLDAAVAAADAWATSNAASYNVALPEPFKSVASSGQKAALLAFVALKRWRG